VNILNVDKLNELKTMNLIFYWSVSDSAINKFHKACSHITDSSKLLQ
jgi:hypothetical protein